MTPFINNKKCFMFSYYVTTLFLFHLFVSIYTKVVHDLKKKDEKPDLQFYCKQNLKASSADKNLIWIH